MKIFVFLFPQFNFSAPKEEAYFKMRSEDEQLACRMKETHLRYTFIYFSTHINTESVEGEICCPDIHWCCSSSKCIEIALGLCFSLFTSFISGAYFAVTKTRSLCSLKCGTFEM